VETFSLVGAGETGGEMNELVLSLNAARIRYLLVGGQAMRLAGMPRFSMDWDFFIPPRDEDNLARWNRVVSLIMPWLRPATVSASFGCAPLC
jgi:hypothetical protein